MIANILITIIAVLILFALCALPFLAASFFSGYRYENSSKKTTATLLAFLAGCAFTTFAIYNAPAIGVAITTISQQLTY